MVRVSKRLAVVRENHGKPSTTHPTIGKKMARECVDLAECPPDVLAALLAAADRVLARYKAKTGRRRCRRRREVV